jgi:hypothetical protein
MRPVEDIKRLIRDLSDNTSAQMDQRMREDMLRALEEANQPSALTGPTIRRIIMKSSIRRAAAVVVICTGVVAVAVVGVKVYKYRYLDTTEDGRHIVLRDDGRKSWVFSKKTADSPEQAVQTAEEMDLLKQQGIKELVSIREIEVNGQLDSRLLGYDYTLSDGRKVRQFEDDPDTGPGTLTDEQMDEARRLLDEVLAGSLFVVEDGYRFFTTAEGDAIPISERAVHGRVFSITKVPLALSDGTQIGWSIGSLSEGRRSDLTTGDSDSANAEQIRNDLREIARLRQQDKRQLIGIDELMVNGELDRRVFVYQYQLSDGRTKEMREDAGGGNFILNSKQRQEWVQSRDAGSGEDLGTNEKKVEGHVFVYTRQRFVLSDGTEVIWLFGTLKDEP